MLSLDSALVQSLKNGRPRYFVRLGFKTGDIYLHTGVGERRFLNRTWLGLGMLGSIGDIPANDKNDSPRIRLTLHTNNDALLGEVAVNDTINLPVEIYLVTVDKHYRVDKYQRIEAGDIVACDVERGDVSKIQLSVAGESERWKKPRVFQRWNHATQQALYPEDMFFKEHSAATNQDMPDMHPGRNIGGPRDVYRR